MAPATLVETSSRDLFPNGGWDTHHHIFEPESFPYSPSRHLTPPAASIGQFHAFQNRLGISNSVLTHGLSYGDDCSSLKAFIPQLGSQHTLGIAVIDPQTTSDDDIRQMHAAGVRGIRINLYRYGAMEDVALQKKVLQSHLDRLTGLSLNWSMTMTTARTVAWEELEPFIREKIAGSGVPLVTDHFAHLKGASLLQSDKTGSVDPTKQPGFQAVMRLVRDGLLWVKLSAPYRISDQSPHYEDLEPLVRAFIDANKERVVWGSDWPHTPRIKLRTREEALTETPFLEVDDEAWLRSLRSWLSDEEWHLLMVENPRTLFGRRDEVTKGDQS